jgi:hypothetical protein
MYIPYRKITAFGGIAGLTLIGILSAKPVSNENPEYKNLKVLPKNISDRDMDYVMETFSVNLGANCLFCHPGKMVGPDYSIDYVTDQLRNKRVARDMLRMTMKLNKKYFNIQMKDIKDTRGGIWCKTCHQGSPVPLLPNAK